MERAKVIKGLQIERECVSRDCDRDCGKCDLVQDRDWLLSVYDGAIALLKEQEKTKVVFGKTKDGEFVTECGNCGTHLDKAYSNCPKCKKELDWNSNQT